MSQPTSSTSSTTHNKMPASACTPPSLAHPHLLVCASTAASSRCACTITCGTSRTSRASLRCAAHTAAAAAAVFVAVLQRAQRAAPLVPHAPPPRSSAPPASCSLEPHHALPIVRPRSPLVPVPVTRLIAPARSLAPPPLARPTPPRTTSSEPLAPPGRPCSLRPFGPTTPTPLVWAARAHLGLVRAPASCTSIIRSRRHPARSRLSGPHLFRAPGPASLVPPRHPTPRRPTPHRLVRSRRSFAPHPASPLVRAASPLLSVPGRCPPLARGPGRIIARASLRTALRRLRPAYSSQPPASSVVPPPCLPTRSCPSRPPPICGPSLASRSFAPRPSQLVRAAGRLPHHARASRSRRPGVGVTPPAVLPLDTPARPTLARLFVPAPPPPPLVRLPTASSIGALAPARPSSAHPAVSCLGGGEEPPV
ncbi:hypothetical protein B0H15DRAFT_983643 [Mycena belliarum]|uniref:Uncharacterized protein n=1 Tax=Mycena belliarum TaxID=1033014 RepID=A0AAD6UGJ7_9AGAR|nr:hypothetical protein B0H15DRAFT_983643 [Mycena belliae]